MKQRMLALLLCLGLLVSLVPPAAAVHREPIAPESVDQCCHTLREDALSPDYVRPDFDGKLIDITPPAGGRYLHLS